MRNHFALQQRALHLIQLLRQRLLEPSFAARHRRRPQDFTRERVLNFPVLMLLLLQKSLKSLQNHLHEFLWQLGGGSAAAPMVSASAVTHARAKLLPSAFVELNQAAVLPTVYGPAHAALAQRWLGHRLLAVDSSLVRLPDSAALREHFGVVQCGNQHGEHESYPEARVSALYDVLNQIALDAHLVASRQSERPLAEAHLPALQAQDLVLTDRGYAGYRWFVRVRAREAHFISRCSRASFAAAQALFARDQAGVSELVTLRAPKALRAECREHGWPVELRVRLVTVRLSTGELEVLATSLVDEAAYPTESFAAVYWRRWGQETYYGRLKGRLDLEHCSGQTVEAVAQDFHALILLSNVESIVIGPAQSELAQASVERAVPVQVNRAVSLHALKSRLIDLLASALPAERVLAELTEWFLHNPVRVRHGRKPPRRKFSPSRSYHYQRRVRKLVF
jgi:hypothetical protein